MLSWISKPIAVKIYIVLTAAFFLTRFIVFVASYGGVEHDSGWLLGTAQNLAKRGIYASYTNTVEKEGRGDFPSIHNRFSVQDENGFVYFPAAITTGPSYIIPQALILKLFGAGWWQYRVWPLINFTVLLLVLFYLTWQIGGFVSLIIFQIWTWLYPQMFVNYTFEAFSEIQAVLLLITSLIFFSRYLTSKKKLTLILSAFCFALAIMTKMLMFLALPAFFYLFFLDFPPAKKQLKQVFIEGLVFLIGLAPVGLFESYRLYYLTTHFGFSSWVSSSKDYLLTYQTNGSGLGMFNLNNVDWNFVLTKAGLWQEIGLINPFLVWLFFILSPLIILLKALKKWHYLIILLYFVALFSFGWFILISPSGWLRHVWQGVIIAMTLLSIGLGLVVKSRIYPLRHKLILIVILTLIFFPLVNNKNAQLSFFLDKVKLETLTKTQTQKDLQGFPSLPIFSLTDQKEAVTFFQKNIGKKDRVYYLHTFLVAELATLVDKVFYPLGRFKNNNYLNPEGGSSYLIFGPYQRGMWSQVPNDYFEREPVKYCQENVFSNESYYLCKLKPNL